LNIPLKKMKFRKKEAMACIALLCLSGCDKETYPPAKLVWAQTGTQPQEFFGHKAAAVGDVTGSGYDDLLVGAPGHSDRKGRAVLYLGSAKGLENDPLWTAEGENPGDAFGDVVGALGDINGNGYTAFFVTASEYSSATAKHCGKVYVYSGGPKGPSRKPIWTAEGTTPGELFGDCAAVVGDVNGDGYPDFMIGAYGFDQFRGKVYLYLGSANGFSKKADWVYEGEAKGDWQGYGIGPAGDVNGDGYGDVVLGAKYHSQTFRNDGKVYLFYGSAKGLAPRPDWTHSGETADSRFGHHLSGAGDVNGDGFADIIIGAPGYDRSRGRAYVFVGSPQGPKERPDAILEGQVTGESFGTDVASADDVNGDGYADVLASGPGYATFPGAANLFLGSRDGVQTRPFYREIGEGGGNSYGSIVGSAGDVNGDGIPDWFVCAPSFGSDPKEAGKVYLYEGAGLNESPFRFNLRRRSNHSMVGPGAAIRLGNDSLLLSLAAKGLSEEVKLEAEVKEAGQPFDGDNLIASDWVPAEKGILEMTGLAPGKAYRWRARLVFKNGRKASHWVVPAFWRLAGSPHFRTLH